MIDSSFIADTAHATPDVAALISKYQATKSNKDVDGTAGFFSRDKLTAYTDATLGWQLPSFDAVHGLFSQYMPNWGAGLSYAKRVIGDASGAVVFVTNTPELFGAEIQTISTVDLKDGKIVRFVDYWDGRAFGAELAAQFRVPAADFPQSFGEDGVENSKSEGLNADIRALHGAMAGGDVEAIAATLHPDVHFEDLTLRVSVRGRKAVSEFLARVAGQLPYAAGSVISHTVGGDLGGAFEWTNPNHAVARGVTAIVRREGLVGDITAVWDGTLIEDAAFEALVLAARA